MVDRLYLITAAFCIGVISIAGCSHRSHPQTNNQLQIIVSIAPQEYFVKQIGDDDVNVTAMVPPGSEPHTFEPKPEQLKALSRADAYLRIRIDFEEAWMDKFIAANPNMLVVDTTQGIQRLPLSSSFAEPEVSPHPNEENLDPHIWLSPRLVKTQAQTIYHTLVQLNPAHQAEYQANLDRFSSEIDALDTDLRQTLQGVQNRKFIVFHPSWGYFARDYNLEMIPIEVGGQEPSAAEVGKLITVAQQENIKVVFAEPQFSQRTANTIAQEIHGTVLLIDPLSADWLNNLRQVAHTLSSQQNQSGLPISIRGYLTLGYFTLGCFTLKYWQSVRAA